MKIIDGEGAIMGRLASYAAKEALKGEKIVIVNCKKILVTGNKINIKEETQEKRNRFGSSQKGPKHHKSSEKIMKRTLRGMLPNFREGRGKTAFKNIMCYNEVPKEFQDKTMIKYGKNQKRKFIKLEFISK
jgi:large subunit ribosomal protein L13